MFETRGVCPKCDGEGCRVCKARTGDRRTSKEAAEYIAPQLPRLQAQVLEVFRTKARWIYKGDLERVCYEKYGMAPCSTRTRGSELVKKGIIKADGEAQINGKGRYHTVWVLA